MRNVRSVLRALRRDRRGVTAIEYGFICLLIFLVIITGLTAIGTNLSTIFSSASSAF